MGLKLLDPRLLKLKHLLLAQDDLGQFVLRQLLKPFACHGGDPYCNGECLWAACQCRPR